MPAVGEHAMVHQLNDLGALGLLTETIQLAVIKTGTTICYCPWFRQS